MALKNELGLITQKDLNFLKKEITNIKKELNDLDNRENEKFLSKKAKKRKKLLIEIIKIVEQEKL